MSVRREWLKAVAAVLCVAGAVGGTIAGDVFKANNTLPLNDPLSWEGGVVPGAADVAVFDERVTAGVTNFVLTNSLAWAGVAFTNTVAPVASGTITLTTNGTDAATLTLGTNGVSLVGAGLALTLSAPLALSDAQTWQIDHRNLIFNSTVSGASEWALNFPSQVVWNVAAGYSGNLIVTNSSYITRFTKSGRWAKSLTQKWGGRVEMTFTNVTLWSSLFLDRTATFNCWNGLTAGGTLLFENGDAFQFPGSRFTLDSGYVIQNGGALSGYELQTQYSTYNSRYTISGGSLALTGGILLGNGLSYVNGEARFLQTGGTVSVPCIKGSWAGCKYSGVPTYELTGGVFRITGTRGPDTGVHLSWNDTGNAAESSGAFLMEGGWADIDQIALGRSMDGAAYAVTNAFSLFKMTGGELVLGSRGLYAARSWNNGCNNSGYAVKLQGGTLTAGDSWSSTLDIFLSDAHGGTVFKTEDTNGVAKTVVLNGALYGPGQLVKRGAGALTLAGAAAYSGKTTVEAGSLVVMAAPSDCYRWTADSLMETNNAPVAAWTDLNGGVAATNVLFSQTPRLIRNEINGHSVVHFNSGLSQYLAIEAAKSPIAGATRFSIVVVFKTGSAGVGGNGYWYGNTGLVDGEQGGIQNDWGMVYSSSGCVGGGAGYPAINKDWTVYSSSSYSVADNRPHVAIYTWQDTNLLVNVDGRTTMSASTSPVVSARNAYRMLFGSVALESGKFFNGDIAEIRIYRNRALTVNDQNLIGSELSATYGVQNTVFSVPSVASSGAGEMSAAAASEVPDPLPHDVSVWDADTLSGPTGTAITAWASTNGLRTATLAAATVLAGGSAIGGATAPKLQPGAINGHNALRFKGGSYSVLGLAADQNPLAGVTNFSVAAVFRTDTPGKTGASRQWYEGMALIDAEEPGVTYDWGLSLTANGRVAGGIGGTDATVFSKPFDLCDGAAHVAVVSYNALGGSTAVMVDGLSVSQSAGVHATPRNVRRLLLGSINGGGFFTGDLASFLLFPECALTEAEMTSLSAALALKYGIRFVSRGNTTIPQGTVTVGGGDVEIYSGAALLLPAATNSPVTLISGQTISGGGTVRGTLALDANATVDIGLAETLTMDALWLRDGSAVCWHHAGNTGNLLSVATLKTAGFATLRIAGGDDLPVRASVIAYTSGTGLDATVWTVTGGKRNTRVEINATAKTIDVVTPKGTLVLIN